MQKFKFSFKIKELEVQIDGSREDVATLTSSIGQQFQGLIQPKGALGDGASSSFQSVVTEDGEISEIKSPGKKRRGGNSRSRQEKGRAYDLKNDPVKYGSPVQGWTTLDKAIWLLYVIEGELSSTGLSAGELSAGEIAETFNMHFRQQGKIRGNNVSRDLGNKKTGAKALVQENSNESPSKWFLTDEGKKYALGLIQKLKTKSE